MAKAPAKPEAAAAAPAKKSKKMLFIIVGAVLVLASGGAGAWFFLMHGSGGHEEKGKEKSSEKAEAGKPPVFALLEPFVVNLQPEDGEKYLQVAMTLQVKNEEQAELLKLHMPEVRSRLLLLLSSKKGSEISTSEGKKLLSEEIVTQVKVPFGGRQEPQEVTSVFFTSFVIQ